MYMMSMLELVVVMVIMMMMITRMMMMMTMMTMMMMTMFDLFSLPLLRPSSTSPPLLCLTAQDWQPWRERLGKALFGGLIMVMIGGYEDRHSLIIIKVMMIIMMFMKTFSLLNPEYISEKE